MGDTKIGRILYVLISFYPHPPIPSPFSTPLTADNKNVRILNVLISFYPHHPPLLHSLLLCCTLLLIYSLRWERIVSGAHFTASSIIALHLDNTHVSLTMVHIHPMMKSCKFQNPSRTSWDFKPILYFLLKLLDTVICIF